MYYFYPYYENRKLAAISYQIFNAVRERNDYLEHREPYAVYDNARHNVSNAIAQIIQKLEFRQLGKEQFASEIQAYNRANSKQIDAEFFIRRSWVRFINGKVVLPNVISRNIGTLVYSDQRGEPKPLPSENQEEIKFLKHLYSLYFLEYHPIIQKSALDDIIKNYPGLTIERLLDKHILKTGESEQIYTWSDQSEYCRYLRNEITLQLWLDIVERDHSAVNFKKFITLLYGVHVWPDSLNKIFSRSSADALCRLATQFLLDEEDLVNTDQEAQKCFFDNPHYAHIKLEDPSPSFKFTAENPYDLIREVENLTWHQPYILEHQESRMIYELCIRLILLCNKNEKFPYQSAINLLNDTKRPFLVYSLQDRIEDKDGHIIPFLIPDNKLASLGIKMLDKIKINDESCIALENNETSFREKLEIKNKFWLECFDIILTGISRYPGTIETNGEVIGEVLKELSNKVFSFNGNNYQYSVDTHQSYRKRYDRVFKIISECKEQNSTFHSIASVKPRIFPNLLPVLFKVLSKEDEFLPRNEFLKLETDIIDLAIEYIRISRTPLIKNEFISGIENSLSELQKEMTSFAYNKLKTYLFTQEISVYSYRTGSEVRKVKRGINEFGLEIVDWGYLYLNFYQNGLLEKLDREFRSSLVFDTTTKEEKYADQNKEQGEKITVYLKILLLAHIIIRKDVNLNGFDQSTKKKALASLEEYIKYYAFQYSKDDLPNSRIDVFEERVYLFNYDMYRQPLTKLLYEAVNGFETIERADFVNKLFEGSNDIGRMLSVLNNIDSQEVRSIIVRKIEGANMHEYIKSRMTITELEDALVEAINSDDHFLLAEPLLKRIEDHLNKIGKSDGNTSSFLFSIKLLLAYKQKDLQALQSIEVPNIELHYSDKVNYQAKKNYYLALFKLNNLSDYQGAINILEALVSHDEKNEDYNFNLHKAKKLLEQK